MQWSWQQLELTRPAWLAALESLLAEQDIAPPEDVTRLRGAWETAYLETPHGAPVQLKD